MSDDDKNLVIEQTTKINKELFERMISYRNTLNVLACDAPISVLCLPPNLESILIKNNLVRVFDLIYGDIDFAKVKGIGEVYGNLLTARINEFLSVG
jgi:hypothetical protein